MGMLFNGPGTIQILQILNNFFGPGTLGHLSASDYANWPLQGGTYAFLKGKGIWFPHDSTTDGKWKHWLDRFDKHKNAKKSLEPTAKTVGDAIADAINNNLSQIEFYAVPDDIPNSTHISAEAINVTDPNSVVSKCIVIYTLTWDKVADQAQRPRSKKPTPKK
jgi:hypothetical protein